MRAVLYTHDMLPITVMKLESWMVEFLNKHGSFYLAVSPQWNYAHPPSDFTDMKYYQVRITAERLIRNGRETFMLFTQDEESALLIEAVFLPGQMRQISEIRQEEFAKGFFGAIFGGRL